MAHVVFSLCLIGAFDGRDLCSRMEFAENYSTLASSLSMTYYGAPPETTLSIDCSGWVAKHFSAEHYLVFDHFWQA